MYGWLSVLPLRMAQALRKPTLHDMVLAVDQSAWGERCVRVARGCLGMGEERKNNVGPDLDLFRRGGAGGPWCAAFVSYVIEDSWASLHGEGSWDLLDESDRERCPFERHHGARRCWKNIGRIGRIVTEPKPGDFALWDRGEPGSWKAHIAIVSRVDDGRWWVIEGNRGRAPAKVSESRGDGRGRFRGFARLPAVGP